MEALCLPEQLSSFHQRTLAQMGKPIIVELFGTMRRSMRATGRGDEGQAGNHDLHMLHNNEREFNQELPGMEGSERGQVLPPVSAAVFKVSSAHLPPPNAPGCGTAGQTHGARPRVRCTPAVI